MIIHIRNYRKIKNNKFFFGLDNNIAKLYLRKTYTNIFLTLTDINNKVIICRTPATAERLWNKRSIINIYAMERIIYDMCYLLKLFKIQYVHLVLKSRAKAHAFFLLEKLKNYGIIIKSMKLKKVFSHNGVRGKKFRRI